MPQVQASQTSGAESSSGASTASGDHSEWSSPGQPSRRATEARRPLAVKAGPGSGKECVTDVIGTVGLGGLRLEMFVRIRCWGWHPRNTPSLPQDRRTHLSRSCGARHSDHAGSKLAPGSDHSARVGALDERVDAEAGGVQAGELGDVAGVEDLDVGGGLADEIGCGLDRIVTEHG